MCTEPKMKIGGKVPVTLHLWSGNSVTVAFCGAGRGGEVRGLLWGARVTA